VSDVSQAIPATLAPQAIEDLIDRLLDRADDLLRFLHRRIPAKHRRSLGAEDLRQEVWDAVFQHAPSLGHVEDREFWSWVVTIARRKLFDAVRRLNAAKRGGRQRLMGSEFAERISSATDALARLEGRHDTPSGEVSRGESIRAVRQAMECLSPVQRQAIAMFHMEGCSRAEIANHMGASVPAVMNHLSRGRRKLRDLLSPDASAQGCELAEGQPQ
jgi:RNA polymerase sigma-70 factor (ECF subfamily)